MGVPCGGSDAAARRVVGAAGGAVHASAERVGVPPPPSDAVEDDHMGRASWGDEDALEQFKRAACAAVVQVRAGIRETSCTARVAAHAHCPASDLSAALVALQGIQACNVSSARVREAAAWLQDAQQGRGFHRGASDLLLATILARWRLQRREGRKGRQAAARRTAELFAETTRNVASMIGMDGVELGWVWTNTWISVPWPAVVRCGLSVPSSLAMWHTDIGMPS